MKTHQDKSREKQKEAPGSASQSPDHSEELKLRKELEPTLSKIEKKPSVDENTDMTELFDQDDRSATVYSSYADKAFGNQKTEHKK